MIDADIHKCGACAYFGARTRKCTKGNPIQINEMSFACSKFILGRSHLRHRNVNYTGTKGREQGDISIAMIPELHELINRRAEELGVPAVVMVRHIFGKYAGGWLYYEEDCDMNLCKPGKSNYPFQRIENIPENLNNGDIRQMLATFCSSDYHVQRLKQHLADSGNYA